MVGVKKGTTSLGEIEPYQKASHNGASDDVQFPVATHLEKKKRGGFNSANFTDPSKIFFPPV